MTIQEKIENYIDYLQDLDYIDAILTSTEPDTLFDLITEMLLSGNSSRIFWTSLFIRDVVNIASSKSNHAKRFYEELPRSKVAHALNKNVFADVFSVRHNAVYTIGKIGLESSIPVLRTRFTYSLDHDPLLLPGLVFELRWLGDLDQWELIEQMALNPYAMTRWAVLSTYLFQSFLRAVEEEDALFALNQLHYLEMLRTDHHPLVRQEAEYKTRQYLAAQNGESDELETPPLTFEVLEIRFGNQLVEMQKDDYTPEELEAFALSL